MNRPGQNLLSRLNFSDHKKGVSLPLKSDYSTKTILSLLSQLKNGYLKMTLPNGQVREFGDKASSLQADIQIFDWNVFKSLMSHGDIGFAESYIRGDWDSSNLKTILELAIRNRTILDKAIYGTWLGSIFYRVKHWLRDNSKSGSRKNIHAHYDLGNAFYSLWLDPSISYSSAWFSEGTKQALGDAQKAKIQRILSCLETNPGDHILEIGCGWGGVMEEALLSGRSITGPTLSTEQKEFAENRLQSIEAATSKPHFEVRLQDYRDCQEQFDGIASVEMFEAVGEKHWPQYFETIAKCLKFGRKACIQTIVIADDLFERYRHSTDFIQLFIS